MSDISRSEDYFRRSRDKSGDTKLLARGLLHMLRHLELEDGRDFKRAQELLDRAWKKSGSEKQIADAMFLVARELKKASSNKSKRVQSEVTRDEFGIIRDIVGEVE